MEESVASSVLDLHPTYRSARFTLKGLYANEGRAHHVADDWRQRGFVVFSFADHAPDGTELHFVATRHDRPPRARARIPHARDARWDATRMFISAFRDVMKKAERKGYGTRWYKDLEENKIYDLVGSFDWTGQVREVAARILSRTILRHPFPNGNHRSSITLMRLYLSACGHQWPAYSLKGRGEARLFRESRSFFSTSKSLLLLIRRKPLVLVAEKHGYTTIRLTPDLEADIGALDLSLSIGTLKDRHVEAAQRLVDGLAADDARALRVDNRLRLRHWVEWSRRATD